MQQIAVIGIGRLGLCLALNLERAGYRVLGVDTNSSYVDAINSRSLQLAEPLVNEYLYQATHFLAGTKIDEVVIQNINLIFVVVPTPSLPSGEFNHGFINQVATALKAFGKQNERRHLVINSTCMPGYCDALQTELEPLNYSVSYNPEFIAQGSIIHDQQHPDQVLIGEASPEAGDLIESVYKKMCVNKPKFCRMTRLSAEITKLATNCFLTTKISFANAIGDLATKAGAEPEKILAAIGADSRIGNKYFNYGFGYGGPCFPRDNKAFTKFAESTGSKVFISEATEKTNQAHADFLFDQWSKKYSNHEQIVFYSVAYKKGTDILEESQQLKLAVSLAKAGKKVKIKEEISVIKQLIDVYGNLFTYELNGN